jgi:hypothetical protein
VYGRNHNTRKLRAGWINIYLLELAMNGLRPADTHMFIHGEHSTLQCQYLITMGDMKTPQMGYETTEWPSWVYSSETVADKEMCGLTWRYVVRIREMMANSRIRVGSIVEAAEGYNIHDAAPADLSADLFLRLRGDFVGCPYLHARCGIVEPVRRGH